jgi:hypothetical protein
MKSGKWIFFLTFENNKVKINGNLFYTNPKTIINCIMKVQYNKLKKV